MKTAKSKILFLGLALYSTSFINHKIESFGSGRFPASAEMQEKSVIASPTPIEKVMSGLSKIEISISTKPSELSKKMDELENSLNIIKVEKEKIQIEVSSKEEEIKKLKEELELEKSDKELLSEKANALAIALETRNKEVGELRQGIFKLEQLKTQLEDIQKQVTTLIEENSYLKTENEKLTCMLEKQKDLEEQIKELTKASQEAATVVLTEEKKAEDKKEEDKKVDVKKEETKVASSDKAEDKDDAKNDKDEDEDEDDKDKDDKKVSRKRAKKEKLDKSDYLEMYAQYFQMALAKQNEQQQMFQAQVLASLQQRGVVNELYGSNVSDQYYNYAANRETAMLAQIERMRLNSLQERLGLGLMSGHDYLDTNSYYGRNSGRNMNFHQDYIQGQPMIYKSQNSFNPQTFNMNERGYNFELNSIGNSNFSRDLASYSPMQASSFSIN